MAGCSEWVAACIAVGLAACAGTETGNPSFEGQLAYDAYSSNVTAVALRQSEPNPDGQAIVIDSAWLVLGDVSLLKDGACDGTPSDAPVNATGIGEGDHAAGGHVVTTLSADAGRYCGVALPFERAGSEPIAGPPELADRSVLIKGRLQDGSPLTLASGLDEVLVLRGDAFELGEGARDLMVGFDLAVWLGALDFRAAERNADGSITVDDAHNAALLGAFEQALIEGTGLFRDPDRSAAARPNERLASGTP
jgi:hypothetical protein